jgi:cytoskeleton protein RodZ
MPEIGQTLREARMRARIDISELEAETKIRAKYLRALENEEWNLLPGPTYVKSFLRTYADSLGLDGRLLVEEYKLRHERLSDVELQPITPRSQRERGRPPRRGLPRGTVVGLVFVLLIGALYMLGRTGGDGEDTVPPVTTPPTTEERASDSDERERPERRRPRRPRTVRLTLSATGAVYVCLRAGEKVLVDQETLQDGQQRGPYRARRFTMTFGNNSVRMRVNGRALNVPASSGAIGYVLDRRGRRPLPDGRRPTCG